MEQASLGDVLEALQTILSSPNLAVSQHLSPPTQDVDRFPVLPRKIPKLAPSNVEHTLASSTPHKGDALLRLKSHLAANILPYLNLSSLSPNYYGFVTGGATPAALLGDLLSTIYDQNVQVHLPRETLSTTLEVVTLNMLVQLFQLPEADWSIGKRNSTGGGTFTTGATASNVLGLALGREYVLRKAMERKGLNVDADISCGECGLAEMMIQAGAKKIQILSTLPHSSIAKAASIVGIGRRNVISISAPNDPLQIDIDHLQEQASKPNVLNILAISTGEVNTGRFATDSLHQWTQIRQICDDHGIWIHVDGAFGLFGRLFSASEERKTEYARIAQGVQGLELADSITGDCHKLLNVPYDCGVFFTRHKSLSEAVFQNGNAAYLTSGAATSGPDDDDGYNAIQSPLNIGIENSRRFRALPVYATLVAYGRGGYLDMLKRQVGLARRVTRWLLRDERFLVLPGESAGETGEETLAQTFIVVLFRVRDEEMMKTFVKRVNDTGKIYLSGTVWDGKVAARIAISNWQIDVQRDGDLIESVLDEVVSASETGR
ncbi:hypothetical protein H2200_007175 [Cladophialophora chaetospira]|uniref:L-2,4-diaminobutyrate decarboxylase n=1 Tax=Cladophialophora chaetospira TaxID=386627 RepID=A0AA39CHA3_9EURO|nr:hypothetical protein H2200_007175 [Cladophialophora chaetospira]